MTLLEDARTRPDLVARLEEVWRRDPRASVGIGFVQVTGAKRLADLAGHASWQVVPRVLHARLRKAHSWADTFRLETSSWAVWTDNVEPVARANVGLGFAAELAAELHRYELGPGEVEGAVERQHWESEWERIIAECGTAIAVWPCSLRLRDPGEGDIHARLEHLFKEHESDPFEPQPWQGTVLV